MMDVFKYSINTGSDTDQLGIAFLTHPDAAGSAATVKTMELRHDGSLHCLGYAGSISSFHSLLLPKVSLL